MNDCCAAAPGPRTTAQNANCDKAEPARVYRIIFRCNVKFSQKLNVGLLGLSLFSSANDIFAAERFPQRPSNSGTELAPTSTQLEPLEAKALAEKFRKILEPLLGQAKRLRDANIVLTNAVNQNVSKYGPFESPHIKIRDGYKFQPARPDKLVIKVKNKDEKYFKQLEELTVLSELLDVEIEVLRRISNDGLQVPLTNLEKLVEDNILNANYVVDSKGTTANLTNGASILKFISGLADVEHDLLNASINSIDYCAKLKAQKVILDRAPGLWVELNDPKKLEELILSPFNRVFTGSSNFPSIVFYPNRKSLENSAETETPAFHNFISDSINVYPQPTFSLIINGFHEAVHAVIRYTEGNAVNNLFLQNAELSKLNLLITATTNLINDISLQTKGFTMAVPASQFSDQMLQLTVLAKERDHIGQRFEEGNLNANRLEESAAMLGGILLLNEWIISRPELDPDVGGALLYLAEESARSREGVEHYGAGKYAFAVLDRYDGDYFLAFRKLGFELSEKEKVEAERTIHSLSEGFRSPEEEVRTKQKNRDTIAATKAKIKVLFEQEMLALRNVPPLEKGKRLRETIRKHDEELSHVVRNFFAK